MSDEKTVNKKDDKRDELISIDDNEVKKITGGIRIGGIEYSTYTVNNELENGPVEVKIKI